LRAVHFSRFKDSLPIELTRHQQQVFAESSSLGRSRHFDHFINDSFVVDARKSLPVIQVQAVIVRGKKQPSDLVSTSMVLKTRNNLGTRRNQRK
jgi:hypothetical protein